ncbi:MAG: adenosylcobinamide-phosphate synthase CbiB [Pseudomonadota bacterium]
MLALALLLDALIGDPDALWRRVPHPVVLMGRLVALLEEGLNHGRWRRAKGVLAVSILCLSVAAPALFLSISLFGGVLEVAIAAILLAQRSLVRHVEAVADALSKSLDKGREAVGHIVGRETAEMQREDVARSAIESAAENFSDGVVAPAFWFLLLGLPGIAVYKAVNTADSMIGHRTPRYEAFGWAAARLDDAMNWIPARLAGVLIAVVGTGREAFDCMMRDAVLHRSPNAGWPEAAMAASLGIKLGGPRAYAGTVRDDPWLNAGGERVPGVGEIRAAVTQIWKAWQIVVGAAAVLWLVALLFGLVF